MTFVIMVSHKMMTRCRCFHQDALRVAVALWALSDGKALSLRLLVGALEGLVSWRTTDVGKQHGELDTMEHHGTSHHKQQSSISKGLDLSTLQISSNYWWIWWHMLLPFLFGRWKHRNITADDRDIQLLAPDSSLVPGRSGGFFRIRWDAGLLNLWTSENAALLVETPHFCTYFQGGVCAWRKPTWRSFE